MTIRSPGQSPVLRPGGQQGTPGGAAQPQQPSLGDALTRLGMMSGGDLQAMAGKLLSFLVLQGFAPKLDNLKGGGQAADDAAKLAEALKNLQGKEGLPPTGKLDEKTLKAMEKYKPATTPGERATERQSASPEKQAGARQAANYRDQALAAWIKAKAPDTGKPQTTAQNAPPPPTVSAQQLQNSKADANTVMQMAQQNAQAQQTPQTQENKGTPHPDSLANPDARATQNQGAVSKSQEGQGKGQQGQGGEDGARNALAKKGTGKADETPGGRSKSEEGLARGDADQLTAFEDGRGNQATGDEDEEDERRGAALVDDGSGVDEGAYEVPGIWEQIRKALREMQVEPQTDPNRPTCYRGDFVFYKPGVYQSRTQAPQLINMKVRTATAYDDVWTKALEQINARIRVFEPGASQLNMDDIHRALQVTRARQS